MSYRKEDIISFLNTSSTLEERKFWNVRFSYNDREPVITITGQKEKEE